MCFYQKYKWLVPSVLFTLLMMAGRVVHTGSLHFAFLAWNILLASVPLYISYKLPAIRNKKLAWLCAGLWLLFFPNAMYITTDIFHLYKREDMPEWYDLLLLLSAALNGLLMGMISLMNVEQWLCNSGWEKKTYLIVFVLFLLCGYGIYLGRYKRWNSWDIIAQPCSLLYSISKDMLHPYRHRETWMLTAFYGVWLFILYSILKRSKVRKIEDSGINRSTPPTLHPN